MKYKMEGNMTVCFVIFFYFYGVEGKLAEVSPYVK